MENTGYPDQSPGPLTSVLADWAALAESDSATSAEAFAQALLRASEPLWDEVLRRLPATPDEAAASMRERPFADRVDGIYLPWAWFEPFCTGLQLPVAELQDGWDIADGEDVFWCPRATLADDPDLPEETRPFVRVDQVRKWRVPLVGETSRS